MPERTRELAAYVFDPELAAESEDRWLRLREEGGTLTWRDRDGVEQTAKVGPAIPSSDGFSWTAQVTREDDDQVELEQKARAYDEGRRRLRLLHKELAGRRQDWANNTSQPCSSARAVAYQSAMQSVGSILDEIEAIAAGVR